MNPVPAARVRNTRNAVEDSAAAGCQAVSGQRLDLNHIAGIDFAGHRLLDQINGQNESVDTLFLGEDSL